MQITNAILEDFDEFLDNEMAMKGDKPIMDKDTASYYVRHVKEINEKKKELTATAKELKQKRADQIDNWLQNNLRSLDYDIDRCSLLLENYYNSVETDKTKKVKLPDGNIGFYKSRDSVDLDKEKLLEFVSNNKALNGYIVNTPSVDTKSLRSDAKYAEVVDDEGNTATCLKVNGVIVPSEIANVTLGTSSFAVR